MARNTEKDKIEELRRRRQLLDTGLRLFSQKGIESVSLQAVVDETDVGIATMYNYYKNKVNFVVAISADMWSAVWKNTLKKADFSKLTACSSLELIEFYCDMIIDLYKERPEILRFSSNYKTYICRENVSKETVDPHLSVLEPVSSLFHQAYSKDSAAGIIRSDVSEEELFRTITITMLAMAERYAEGIVWTKGSSQIHINELNHIKEMILLWCRETDN